MPELRFGVVQGDPADALFAPANFPGASTTNITNARALYAILTGRVSEVRGVARLNEATGKYEYGGLGRQSAHQRQAGIWLQDSWHVSPNVTVGYGARYDLTFPFVALNNSYSIGDLDDVYGVSGVGNLFKPGVLTGQAPSSVNSARASGPTRWIGTTSRRASGSPGRRPSTMGSCAASPAAPASSWFAPGTTDRIRASA